MTDQPITIRSDLRPGDLGRIIALHGTAYDGVAGHFGLRFEAFVARTIAEFVIDNAARGKIFLAERNGDLMACAAMVERRDNQGTTHGQLRWVLADPSARGLGLGKKLIDLAVNYARDSGWRSVFLETTDGLDASMKIYEALGFVVENRESQSLWSNDDVVITMRLGLQ